MKLILEKIDNEFLKNKTDFFFDSSNTKNINANSI